MKKAPERTVVISSVALGVTSMVSQIVILRELLVAFCGNELSVGLTLASWLALVGVSAWAFGRAAERVARRPHSIVLVQTIFSILIPVSIIISSGAREALSLSAGEIVALGPMVLVSLAVLAPMCLLLGFTFPLLCASYSRERTSTARIGIVYVLEAAGSSLGGLIFSLALIRYLSPVEVGFLLAGINLAVASLAATSIRIRLLPLCLLAAYITGAALGATEKFEEIGLKARWHSMRLEYNGNSIYGNVSVVALPGERSFYENGLLSFSTGEKRSAEETAHIALLAHPNPRKVLLIGGGISGVLEEILKHPIEELTYVELDPLIVTAARELGLPEIEDPLKDRRVRLVFDDGRRYVKSTADSFDVVISNLPDPLTALVNRFYSVEYFDEVDRILKPGGILSIGLVSAENYLNQEQQRFLSSIRSSLRSSFDDILLVPGDYTYMLASRDSLLAEVTYDTLLERADRLGIKTDFITRGYLPERMNPERTRFFSASIDKAIRSSMNSDARPAGYFYATVAWLTRFNSRSASLLNRASLIRPLWYLFPFVLLFAGVAFPAVTRRDSGGPIAAAIFTTGYSEMVFQVVVLYSFQVLFGYLYYRLGVILTSFMIGLALGGLFMTLKARSVRNGRALYLKLQAAMCIYPVFLAVFILAVSRVSEAKPLPQAVQTAFAFLPILAGFLGGIQFPLAAHILLGGEITPGRTAGYLYGVDLLGSCLGAVLSSAILIPVIGLLGTCMVAFFGNATALLLIILSLIPRRLWR
jgi:spermidine synthase